MAKLNRAAFSREDVEDAKRGHPDFDLRGYASWNAMEFLDHATLGGYRAALPCGEELQSYVLRGTLPGGEYGVMAYEGLQIGWSVNPLYSDLDWGGSFYGVCLIGRRGKAQAARVPCTVAAVRVPETAGTHHYMRIDGYLRSEALDDLGRAAGLIAKRLREVCVRVAEPRPFDTELPRPLSSEARDLPVGFYPAENWRKLKEPRPGRVAV